MSFIDLEKFPLVERLVTTAQADSYAATRTVPTTEAVVEELKVRFDKQGPFHFAKAHGVLVRESGEEFAIQLMTVINMLRPGTY